jgi:hypothetical protein
VIFFQNVTQNPVNLTGELQDEKDQDFYLDEILGELAHLLK